MSNGLDLYAKIEPLIPFGDAIDYLYDCYKNEILDTKATTLLDVGCGNGKFIQEISKNSIECFGIDLSAEMIKKAKNLGCNVACKNLSDVDKKYDVVTAVFDVLNYIPPKELDKFLSNICNVLNKDGYFIADINTFFGFSEVADGSLVLEGDKCYGSLHSEFNDDQLKTKLRLFSKVDELYALEEDEIIQYFHEMKALKKNKNLKLIKVKDLFLFSEEPDKQLLIFKKMS